MIGERLAEIRKDNDDRQEDLAEKLKVSLPTVRSWEQERSTPSHDMLVAICRLYGVSADFLLGLSDVDPVYARRRAEALTKEDQLFLKDVQEFLAWRRRRNNNNK